ncbi:hypothetical protein K523DRAFT_283839 [Schizophyllum commune Tattone D]|nr:hypothetical protein K523DRAFT_283839 [Schizophyllum commune Tattone D]
MSCFNITKRSLFSQSSSALSALSRHSRVLLHDTLPFVVQKRGKRTRGFPGLLQNALKREERHLNRLTDYLESVKVRRDKEAAFAREDMAKHGIDLEDVDPEPNGTALPDANNYFWQRAFTAEERERMSLNKINGVEDLVTFQTEAKMLLETPDEKGKKRRLADLEPPQRLAQEMYKVLQKRTGLSEKDLWQ